MSAASALLADIGGTNARFAVAGESRTPDALHVLNCDDHADIGAAIRAYRGLSGLEDMPSRAAIAVAAPVEGDAVRMTNHPWAFSIAALKAAFGFTELRVVNDFAAIAMSLPSLTAEDLFRIGGGRAVENAPRAVLGPGTGLGVSGLIPGDVGWIPVATEGGHVTLAASTDREAEILSRLRNRFGHVSAERAVSGPGLQNLYRAVSGKEDVPPPDAITAAALSREDAAAVESFDLFCGWLGGVAGNLALTYGAHGGVYVAGGIAPRIVDALAKSAFRARFEDKGRYRDYLSRIPTWVITRPQPALLGLASLLYPS